VKPGRLGPIAFALGALCCLPLAAQAAPLPARIDLRAGTIGLFLLGDGSTLLDAKGRVVLHDGVRTIDADAMRFDLKANTLVATGEVLVSHGAQHISAAAYALDLKSGNAHVLRLDGGLPAMLAVHDDDVADATEAPAPPSTFALVDLGGLKPFLRTRHAIVTPSVNVRLTPAEVPTGPGPYIPTPSYLYTFAPTNFSQSALPYATFDQPYPLFGTANSLTAGHFRYDSTNGPTIGLDEHLVDGNRAYAVASILPLRGEELNLNAFEQLQAGLTQSLNGYHVYGANTTNYIQYQSQWTSPSSRTTLSAYQLGTSNSAQLTLGSIEHTIPFLFTYRAQISYGYDHFPGQIPFNNDFRIGTDAYVSTPKVVLPLKIGASAKYEYAITEYDFPHEVTTGTTTVTLSRAVNRSLSFLGTISLQQIADHYRDPRSLLLNLNLPNPALPYYAPDGTPYPGIFAYSGINTYRTYALQTTWRPHGGENAIQVYYTHTDDFPQFHGYGPTPNSLTLDVTERLGATFRLEVARTYTFGWGGQYFVPGYSISISP
jgi:hypothetical protein